MLRLIAVAAFLVSTAAQAALFDFGMPGTISIPANTPTLLPASIINRSGAVINFGCARVPCGGPDFGASAPSVVNGSFTFPNAGNDFYDQFVGLVLDPNEQFNFSIGLLEVNSSFLASALTFGFRFEDERAFVSPLVTQGQTAFGPTLFTASTAIPTLPELPGPIRNPISVPEPFGMAWFALLMAGVVIGRRGIPSRS
jgi:hypothetical protein